MLNKIFSENGLMGVKQLDGKIIIPAQGGQF